MNSGFGWEEPFEDDRSGPEDQADDWSTTNDCLWLESEVQRPDIDVRSYPSFRHSGQGPEGLKVTHSGS